MSRSFGTEDSHPWFGGTSTNPVGLFGRNEPPSRFADNLRPEGYDEYFDPPLENKYKCPICLLGLREPVQTPCGHRFCHGCILHSIRDAGPKCPVDNEHLEELQLNPDNFARREVLNHHVLCPWKELYECSWKGPLSRLENHFQDCPQFLMSCEKCGKENIPSNEMQDHNEKDCPRAELKCPFSVVGCPFEGPRTAVNEHVREQMFSHLTDLTKEFEALKFEQTGLQAQRQAIILARRDSLERFCQRLQREIVDLRSFAIGNGAELRRRPNGAEIDTLKARVENLERQLQELTARFNRQETRAFEFEGTEFRQHISESLIAKPNRSAFQRPIVPRNYKGYGYVEFVPIELLRDSLYIKNNTMLGTLPAVVEHVMEEMVSHLMDFTKEFKALRIEQQGLQAPKSCSRCTGGVEAQEQANQEVLLMNLAALCQRQQTEIDGLRDLVNEMRGTVERLERRLNESRMRVETPLQELTIRLNRQEAKGFDFKGRVCNGCFIWRIENYRQRRQDAINGIETALLSPAFYTSLYGYKLCLRINLNGVDSGVGRYIALFVHMMQGDYDSILEWPFTGRITLTILDQSEGTEFRQHISKSFIVNPNLLAFRKLAVYRNREGHGYVDFAPIEQICEPQYIRNDTMLVRIQIYH